MRYLPVFLNMENRKVLLVGGGRAAEIKLSMLVDFSCQVHVVAKTASAAVEEMCERNACFSLEKRSFTTTDLENVFLCVCAADSKTNEEVKRQAQKRQVLVGCTGGIQGDFILPAHKREGDVTAAVSTNGKFPLLAKKISESFDLSMAANLPFLEQKRQEILKTCTDRKEKRRLLEYWLACMEEKKK